MNRLSPQTLIPLLKPFVAEEGLKIPEEDENHLTRVIACLLERSRTLKELAHSIRYFYRSDFGYEEKGAKKFLTAETRPRLQKLRQKFLALTEFLPRPSTPPFRRSFRRRGSS